MELAYIWVEKFRNIVEQGFNISSKYIFNYDKERSFLEIRPNEKWIDNFFENPAITNVTAIVGQNASGKTNVLELINYALCEGNTKIAEPFFMVFCGNDRFTLVTYLVQTIKSNLNDNLTYINYDYETYVEAIYCSNIFDGRRHDFGKKVYDISTNTQIQNQYREGIMTKFKKEIQNQILFMKSSEFDFLQKEEGLVTDRLPFNLRPTHVNLTSPNWSYIYTRSKAFDRKMATILDEDYSELTRFCVSFRKKITDNQSSKSIYYLTAFLLYIDFIINEFAPQVGRDFRTEETNKDQELRILKFEEFSKQNDGKNGLRKELDKICLEQLKDARINEIHGVITNDISRYIDAEYPYAIEKAMFLSDLGRFEYYGVEKQHEGTHSNRKIQFRSEYNPEIESFIYRYLRASTGSNLDYAIEWNGISSGHKAFLNLFSRFHSIKNDIKSGSILITLDEGDLYFHPKWQTEYLYKLLEALPKIFNGKEIQLILTTHSPFLISDLTKNNLIFLKKDQNGLCNVIPNEKIEGETFGGNIGELYLDAFFLDGNLISRFAAKKINILATKAVSKIPFKEADFTLLNSIGEDIIKLQIKRLVDDQSSR